MRIKYLKLKNWMLVSLAGLLGLPMACEMPCEYGTPEASYRVKGRVVDTDGQPVEGIGASLRYLNEVPSQSYQDTTGTDGQFVCIMHNFPGKDTIKIDFHDTDSSEHGNFRDTTVNVSFKGATFSGGDGHWYDGEATREVEVELQRVKE